MGERAHTVSEGTLEIALPNGRMEYMSYEGDKASAEMIARPYGGVSERLATIDRREYLKAAGRLARPAVRHSLAPPCEPSAFVLRHSLAPLALVNY